MIRDFQPVFSYEREGRIFLESPVVSIVWLLLSVKVLNSFISNEAKRFNVN